MTVGFGGPVGINSILQEALASLSSVGYLQTYSWPSSPSTPSQFFVSVTPCSVVLLCQYLICFPRPVYSS